MKILFIASELAPFAKVGGLGDVIGSLPKALVKLGIKVAAIIPLYEAINRKEWRLERVDDISVDDEMVRVFRARLPQSQVPIQVFFLENLSYLSKGPIYFDRTAFASSQKDFKRFLFFSRAVFEILKLGKFFSPEIVHCHDWHSGLLVAMLRNQKSKIQNQNLRTVFTIHNLANQGIWDKRNPMAEGIKNADIVTTVSSSYAKEILTKKYGEGLEDLLRKRTKEKKLIGILNGVDYNFWPIERRDKISFQKSLRLKQNPAAPIFGLVSRLTYQKGIHLIIPVVEEFVKKIGAQFIFLGQGEKDCEKALLKLSFRHPSNIFVKIGFNELLARRIYAQSDFFLMPSIFEPCGLGQMISMHYGTIPIVRATGGLKDTVRHLKTGFVFKEPTPAAFKRSLKEAVDYFLHKPDKFGFMKLAAKKADFDWDKSALKYQEVYKWEI